jgi:hypothetical protein
VTTGSPPSEADKALRAASVDLIAKREDRAKELASTLIGQVVVIASILGMFNLLGEPAKSFVLHDPLSVAAVICAGLSVILALASFFLPPWEMPDLDHLTKLRRFWNRRAFNRRLCLLCSFVFLAAGVACAGAALDRGIDRAAPVPAATLSGKATMPKDAPATFQVVAGWVGLRGGDTIQLLVCTDKRSVLATAHASADRDGKVAIDLIGRIPGETKAFTAVTWRGSLSGVACQETLGPSDAARLDVSAA